MANNNKYDYDGIYTSLAHALSNGSSQFFYDFGQGSSYEKVHKIFTTLTKYGYDVKFRGTGLLVKMTKKGKGA